MPRERSQAFIREDFMLKWVGLALLVLWAVLWIGFKIVSVFVHVLVIVGIVLLVRGLFRKGANAIRDRSR
ncbi:MAG: hypothetical protein ABR543_02940 [Gemmatimonadaceae bacterium]